MPAVAVNRRGQVLMKIGRKGSVGGRLNHELSPYLTGKMLSFSRDKVLRTLSWGTERLENCRGKWNARATAKIG